MGNRLSILKGPGAKRPPDDDLILVDQYQNGDQSSLEQIYFKYKKRLLRLLWYYVHHMEDAEDLLQTLFMKLISGLKMYRRRQGVLFRTWLFRVAVNTAKDHLRKKRFTVRVEDWEKVKDPSGGLIENAEKKELAREVRSGVMCLPLKYREVLVMIYFEGLKYEDAAKILNRPLGTVKSRCHYGLELLRKKIGEKRHERK